MQSRRGDGIMDQAFRSRRESDVLNSRRDVGIRKMREVCTGWRCAPHLGKRFRVKLLPR